MYPAWQNRQPRVQPRMTSNATRSWTICMWGTSWSPTKGAASRSSRMRRVTFSGALSVRRRMALKPFSSYSAS